MSDLKINESLKYKLILRKIIISTFMTIMFPLLALLYLIDGIIIAIGKCFSHYCDIVWRSYDEPLKNYIYYFNLTKDIAINEKHRDNFIVDLSSYRDNDGDNDIPMFVSLVKENGYNIYGHHDEFTITIKDFH